MSFVSFRGQQNCDCARLCFLATKRHKRHKWEQRSCRRTQPATTVRQAPSNSNRLLSLQFPCASCAFSWPAKLRLHEPLFLATKRHKRHKKGCSDLRGVPQLATTARQAPSNSNRLLSLKFPCASCVFSWPAILRLRQKSINNSPAVSLADKQTDP